MAEILFKVTKKVVCISVKQAFKLAKYIIKK